LPKIGIKSGEYSVACIGLSVSDYVDVLTFKDGQDSKSPGTYYRFPAEAFDGQINTEATKLIVVEVDGFKKLVLK